MNESKTEFIIFSTNSKLGKVRIVSVHIGDKNIMAVKQVWNIGAFFDSELKMDIQIKNMCRGAWMNLYNIGKIRSYLTVDQAKSVVHAYVIS